MSASGPSHRVLTTDRCFVGVWLFCFADGTPWRAVVWPLCTLDGQPARVLGLASIRAHAGPGTVGGVCPTCFLGSLAVEVLKVPSAFQDTNSCVFCLTLEELL